jgi:hypothetical protein
VTPGNTPWKEVNESLAPLGDAFHTALDSEVHIIEFQFIVPEEIDPIGYFWPTMRIQDEIVQAININNRWISRGFDFSFSGILLSLGKPDEVWIWIIPVPDDERPSTYTLELFCPSKGINVQIHGGAVLEGDILTVCPQEFRNYSQFPPGLLLWSANQEITFEEIDQVIFGIGNRASDNYQRLEDLTETMDTAQFYEIYKNPSASECFNIQFGLLD